MLVMGASDSALELMQGGEMSVIHIHISVQSRIFLLKALCHIIRAIFSKFVSHVI